MPAENPAKANNSDVDVQQTKTRLLLALWDMGGTDTDVRKGQLTDRVKRKNEKSGDYQQVFEQLQKVGAIEIATKNRAVNVSLTEKGLKELEQELKSSQFQFDSQIGARTANALLRWFREQGTSGDGKVESSDGIKSSAGAISSYDEFKQVALDVYDKLNRDYNLDNLVPIYRMRREIGDQVSRSQFNEWLLEMQANDIFQLQGGSVEDSAPDKIEDSITTELDGLRCYARLL